MKVPGFVPRPRFSSLTDEENRRIHESIDMVARIKAQFVIDRMMPAGRVPCEQVEGLKYLLDHAERTKTQAEHTSASYRETMIGNWPEYSSTPLTGLKPSAWFFYEFSDMELNSLQSRSANFSRGRRTKGFISHVVS